MKRWVVVALAASLTACFSTVKVNAPEGGRFELPADGFPYALLDRVLAKVVDDHGRVDYKTLAGDRADLERFLAAVAQVSPHSNPELFPAREDRLAYWLDAYDAYVLYAVTERPAMRSVNDDATSFFYFTRYSFGGEEISLYNLENEVVRGEFAEPRVHFALNCASVGCPRLPREAFVPARLEDQLGREAREFCVDPEKVRANGNTVEVSRIFDWYSDDFTADGGPVAFCRKWGRGDLPAPDVAEVSFITYDWTLNAQAGRALFE